MVSFSACIRKRTSTLGHSHARSSPAPKEVRAFNSGCQQLARGRNSDDFIVWIQSRKNFYILRSTWPGRSYVEVTASFMKETVAAGRASSIPGPDSDEFYCDLLSREVTDILKRVTAFPTRFLSATATRDMDHNWPPHATPALTAHSSREGQMQGPILRPADSIREAQNGDGAVLLDMGRGTCYGMNRGGARIWQLL